METVAPWMLEELKGKQAGPWRPAQLNRIMVPPGCTAAVDRDVDRSWQVRCITKGQGNDSQKLPASCIGSSSGHATEMLNKN